MRPVIGITVSGYAEYEGIKLRADYFRQIEAVGGLPVLLPSLDPTLADEVAAVCQGLLFSGGGDLASYYLGEPPHPRLGLVEPERDAFELALARAGWQQGKALFGICRGMQLLNVALGGTLWQDLGDCPTAVASHQQQTPRQQAEQWLAITEPRLQALLGERLCVNSFHHQAVKTLAPPLLPAARAADGVLEAFVAAEPARFCLGVQWHPEALWQAASQHLFAAFVACAAGREHV